MVVHNLINKLSNKNPDDIHMAINASSVLNEFCDNEAFFELLIEPETLKRIVMIVCTTDSNR